MKKIALALILCAFAYPVAAQDVVFNYAGSDFNIIRTAPAAITGTMNIEFGTRIEVEKDGTPRVGAVDTYRTDLTVLDSFVLQGAIKRRPWLPTGIVGSTKQDGYLSYDLKTLVKNPKNPTQTRPLGSLIGALRLDGNGRYFLGEPTEGQSNLRFVSDSIGKITGFSSSFSGEIQGRVPEQAGLYGLTSRAATKVNKTFTRVVNGRVVTQEVKGADPMKFDRVQLAQGPLAGYAPTKVAGSIDYDGERGIWYVEVGLSYAVDGQTIQDRFSGTMRWNEDPARATNGIGWYDVNVRVNERPTTEQDAFLDDATTSEDAFFEEDNTVPGFTGRIDYVDTFQGEDAPTASKITYNVSSKDVTKIQTANFAKLLLLIVGPFNDE
jgi:hypothetical protein